jgi:hypothetical protein
VIRHSRLIVRDKKSTLASGKREYPVVGQTGWCAE